MPAQVEIYAEGEDDYKLLFIAKGGGSANKAFLFQATPSILTHDRMMAFLKEKVLTLGTAACPPYHLAIVIGGTSAELTMKTVKLASTKYLDNLPTQGSRGRPRLPRSRDGAGGAEDDAVARRRRAVRRQVFLPRRARDPPAAARRVAADRARRVVLGRPAGARQDHAATACSSRSSSTIRRSICRRSTTDKLGGEVVKIDLNRPMKEILATLSQISDQDAALAHRPDDRGARSRARQAARAAGKRAGAARLLQEPSGLLRRAGEDAGGLCVGRVRADHGGADGLASSTISRRPAARW